MTRSERIAEIRRQRESVMFLSRVWLDEEIDWLLRELSLSDRALEIAARQYWRDIDDVTGAPATAAQEAETLARWRAEAEKGE